MVNLLLFEFLGLLFLLLTQVQFHGDVRLAVVSLEKYSVEQKSFRGGQPDFLLVLGEGVFYELLIEVVLEDAHQHADHFPNLVEEKALAMQENMGVLLLSLSSAMESGLQLNHESLARFVFEVPLLRVVVVIPGALE